jgi:protein associated with RNAse G/E
MQDARDGRLVRVSSTKFDGSLHQDYVAHPLDSQAGGEALRLYVSAGTAMRSYRGEFTVRQAFTQLFWPGADCWWNVEHFHEPLPFANRPSLLTYANVSTPAEFDGETIRWVDLDLDVIVTEAGVRLIDEDEFEEHRERFGYPDDLVMKARAAAELLIDLASRGERPFDRASYIERRGDALLREPLA